MKFNKITKGILIFSTALTLTSIIGIVNIINRNREESIISNQNILEEKQENLKKRFDRLEEQFNNKEQEKQVVNSAEKQEEQTANLEESINRNIIEDYNDEQLKKLNIFLSNFSEVYFEDFSINNYDSKKLIDFAMNHLTINNYEKSMKFDDDISRAYIDELNVQNSIYKYFGINVKNQSTDIFEYYDRKYLIPLATGGQHTNFTQVKEIYNDISGLKIIGEIYSNEDYIDSISYDNSWVYNPMDRTSSFNKRNIKYLGEIEAMVKVINNNGNQTYKLLNYKLDM